MKSPRGLVRAVAEQIATHIRRHREVRLGVDAFFDMHHLTAAGERPMIFDVGANVGQSIRQFKKTFKAPIIHSFEPDATTFEQLRHSVRRCSDVTLNNMGLGREPSQKVFYRNEHSDMSSFLEPGSDCWGAIKDQPVLTLSTVDTYCAEHRIDHVDILKSDTQGFDLEVVAGAEGLMRDRRIHLVYLEIIFSDMYKRYPGMDTIYQHMIARGFRLVSFYRFHHQRGHAAWSDVLFMLPGYMR